MCDVSPTEADVDIVFTRHVAARRATSFASPPSSSKRRPARWLWSQTSQLRLGDLFKLQDDLASRIVESLSLPLTDAGAADV